MDGTDGRDGVSGWNRVEGVPTSVQPETFGNAVALCPAGQKPLGGGFASTATTGGPEGMQHLDIVQSEPLVAGGMGWKVTAVNESVSVLDLIAYAVCADMA
jgi:hypothetical protein